MRGRRLRILRRIAAALVFLVGFCLAFPGILLAGLAEWIEGPRR